MKHPITNKIAYCPNKWSIPVIVDAEGSVFINIPNASDSIPFTPSVEYKLIDGGSLHDMVTKNIMAEMKITMLKKKVEENYSSDYLNKYFKEKVVDLPNLELVNKIIAKHNEFLDITIMGKGEYHDKWNEIKNQNLPKIDKDLAFINLFMEFIK